MSGWTCDKSKTTKAFIVLYCIVYKSTTDLCEHTGIRKAASVAGWRSERITLPVSVKWCTQTMAPHHFPTLSLSSISFFMTVMISWGLQYFIRALRGPCPSAAGQGPQKDGEDRWMAWRKAARGRGAWMLPVVHDQKTVSEGIKDGWIWCRRYQRCGGHHCRQKSNGNELLVPQGLELTLAKSESFFVCFNNKYYRYIQIWKSSSWAADGVKYKMLNLLYLGNRIWNWCQQRISYWKSCSCIYLYRIKQLKCHAVNLGIWLINGKI